MKKLQHLFDRNEAWANEVRKKDPNFFSQLSQQQAPEYLWIGCSDSRVPANQIVQLPPGEVFVHRNIANVVVQTDLNCLSVLQYSVEVLKVKHIIVCGHYGCGGVKAAFDNKHHGLIDNWLRSVKEVGRLNADRLEGLPEEQKLDRLCELNVIQQVSSVCRTTVVEEAWENGAELSVHGWIYSIDNGVLKDLDTSISSNEELANKSN